jgi:hypothetical protein
MRIKVFSIDTENFAQLLFTNKKPKRSEGAEEKEVEEETVRKKRESFLCLIFDFSSY